jgi:gamma-glutamylcyclotransferase (GGCT)/AIG2-like uncharacterized protein YtfP
LCSELKLFATTFQCFHKLMPGISLSILQPRSASPRPNWIQGLEFKRGGFKVQHSEPNQAQIPSLPSLHSHSHMTSDLPSKMTTQPRPLFIYGTLRALPLLAWALTGEAPKVDTVSRLIRKATVKGYKRCSVHHADYPAAIKDDESTMDGCLLLLENASQRKKLDDFEGESYKVTPVTVSVESGEIAEADMHVWDGDREALSSEPWHLEVFIRDRLDDWIDLLEGMELVG